MTPSPPEARPRLLDLFCGAGGAAVGYHRAGFEVVGVDNRPQPNYPFKFKEGTVKVESYAMTCPEQLDVAYRAYRVLGWSPWPSTRRMCGL